MINQAPTEFADGVDKQVKIGSLAAMIRDRNTDRKSTVNPCARSHGRTAFLELTQYLVIQCVKRRLIVSYRAEPETNDVERHLGQALHVWQLFNDTR